jgi:hypothetical protein
LSARIAAVITALFTLWVTALIDGIIAGVGVNIGVEPTEAGIGLFILEAVCHTTESTSAPNAPVSAPQICWTFYGVVAVVSIVVFLINVFGAAAAVGNWRWGLVIYAFGFIPGLLLIVTAT